MGRPTLILFLPALLVLGACSSSSQRVSTDPSSTGPDYLRGIETQYSARISELGDLDLLGPDSVMRHALVAGDQELLVAASLFEVDGVFGLDLIVLNHSGQEIHLSRSDLHLVGANGRWLLPLDEFDAGIAYGLRGRAASAPPATPAFYGLFDTEFGRDDSVLARADYSRSAMALKAPPRIVDERRSRDDRNEIDSVTPVIENTPIFAQSPTRVRVRNEDGKAFWGYFEDDSPSYPLTAMIIVGDEQLLFRFDR